MYMFYNPMQDEEFASVVALLEQGSDRLVALTAGRDRDVPKDRLYRRSRDKVGEMLRTLKGDVFDAAWDFLTAKYRLKNASEDKEARAKLRHEFVWGRQLDFTALEAYFQQRGKEADRLALEAIVKKAREALPSPYCYSSEPEPSVLVHGCTVRLEVLRDYYRPDVIGWSGQEKLAALDKLGAIVVSGTPPSYARAGWLTGVYRYRANANGKRKFESGPFAACRSFKNGRFDLVFATQSDALRFAQALSGQSEKWNDHAG